MMMLRIMKIHQWQKTEAKHSSTHRYRILTSYDSGSRFPGVHLFQHGVSGRKEAVNLAYVLTSPQG